jgi:hypothetical protein
MGEVEGDQDMYVGGCSCLSSNVLKEKFWFRKAQALHVDKLRIWIWEQLTVAHLEEAVEDEDKFWGIGGKSFPRDIFLTLAANFVTEALALEHLFLN